MFGFDHDHAHAFVAGAFWLFLIIIFVVPMLLRFRARMEIERTIRTAIEKGQPLDPQVVDRLLGSHAWHGRGFGGWHGYGYGYGITDPRSLLRVRGVVMIGIGAGLLAFGTSSGPEILRGVGMLVGSIGAALLVGSFLVAPPADRDGDRGRHG